MTRVSVELVPRSAAALADELEALRAEVFCVDVINIPELLRYELHSWEAADIARNYYNAVMPHIRAIDIDLEKPLPMAQALRDNGVREVLVITGDPPQDMMRKIYPTVSTDVIRKFREEMPEIKVYAGLDQYRSSMREEAYNIRRKVQAGAAGFFTQPFYDLRYLEIYAEILEGKEVYWGVSPILSERSALYWQTKNNVILPRGFAPTMQWNVDFARKVVDFVQRSGTNLYFMPIRTNALEYLTSALRETLL